MVISREAFEKISEAVPDEPPETGGIIGSSHGEIIDSVVMDNSGFSEGKVCSYSPNVDFLNNYIAEWQNDGLSFKGLFHTHFASVETLSCADKHYISAIMNAMPRTIKYLYFPIFVLPDRRIVGYRAEREVNITRITHDPVIVQD